MRIRDQLTTECKKFPVTHNEHIDIVLTSVSSLCVTQVARYVWNKKDFDAVDPETTDYLMGELCCCPLCSLVLQGKGIPISLLKNKTSALLCPQFTRVAPLFHLVPIM